MAALAQVVGAGVNDDRALWRKTKQRISATQAFSCFSMEEYCTRVRRDRKGKRRGGEGEQEERRTHAQNAILPDELDVLVGDGALGVALGVGLEVAQIPDVALVVRGRAVRFAEGVDCGRGQSSQL